MSKVEDIKKLDTLEGFCEVAKETNKNTLKQLEKFIAEEKGVLMLMTVAIKVEDIKKDQIGFKSFVFAHPLVLVGSEHYLEICRKAVEGKLPFFKLKD